MSVTVRLFGPQRAMVGSDRITLTTDGGPWISCAALRGLIVEAQPALRGSIGASRFAVNDEFVDDSYRVCKEDEVALIGLVSGG